MSTNTIEAEAATTYCSLYLAESFAINAGWGIFAGKDYSFGEKIGEPGLGIPFMVDLSPTGIDDEEEQNNYNLYISNMMQYVIESHSVGGYQEVEKDKHAMFSFLPGIRTLTNYHSILNNAVDGGLAYEDGVVTAEAAAATTTIGSQTNYHNYTMIASQVINMGDEIFMMREDKENDNGLTIEDEKLVYQHAEKIVQGLLEYHQSNPNLTEEQWIDILYRMRTEILIDADAKLNEKNRHIGKLLPETLDDLLEIQSLGGLAYFHLDTTKRDIEWIRKNGYCMDNIREGKSLIEGGGNGAFATRKLIKDSIITPMPLVFITQKKFLNDQLLLNYCFGHRKSKDLLLCPLSNIVLINHNSTSSNAEIRWMASSPSEKIDLNINYYRTKGLEEIQKNGGKIHNKLMFEVVATRNIEAGEEIYLDYGPEWESNFQAHGERCVPPSSSSTPTASELNVNHEDIVPSSDLSDHYAYECRLEPFSDEKNLDADVFQSYDSHLEVYPENWSDYMKQLYGNNDFICWYPCVIESINEQQQENGTATTFVARIHAKKEKENKVIRLVQNIPRNGIRFVDAPYSSNYHLKSAFRHYIPIPDLMFPPLWRDDFKPASSFNLGKKTRASAAPAATTIVDEENHHQAEQQHEAVLRAAECGVYYAPSNIPNAGFGIYTALPLSGDGVVARGTPIPVIPFYNGTTNWSFYNYFWKGSEHYAEYETSLWLDGFNDTDLLVVNEGSLANYHPGLVNQQSIPAIFEPMLDRCTDPGAGAFSDYINSQFFTSFVTGAGEEMFVDYGTSWTKKRPAFQDVPLSNDWEKSNQIMAMLWALTINNDNDSFWKESEIIDFLDLIKQTIFTEDDQHRTKVALSTVSSMEELSHVIERNGTAQSTMQVRSQQWLSENGHCLDHVYVTDSTIKQAGKGCFARRFLKKNAVVLSSPMLTTFGKERFEINITEIREQLKKEGKEYDIEINEELLVLNYHFTHPKSSVYLFPTTSAIMFNHNSQRMPTDYGREPNAKLRWSTRNEKNNLLLQRPLEDLKKEPYSAIALDIVATRDIEVDEEVFIDYGIKWEEAWKMHLQNWQSPCSKDGGVASHSSRAIRLMNDDKSNPKYYPWSKDRFTVCGVNWNAVKVKDIIFVIHENETITPYLNALVQEQRAGKAYQVGLANITWHHPGFQYARLAAVNRRLPCVIIGDNGRNEEKPTLQVAILGPKWRGGGVAHFISTPRPMKIVSDYPVKDIEFMNRPFKSDMHWKGAFRHPINIPDDIFPPQWKDLS